METSGWTHSIAYIPVYYSKFYQIFSKEHERKQRPVAKLIPTLILKGPTGTFCKLALKVAPYRPEYENMKINENLCKIFEKNKEKGRILAISWGSFQTFPVRGLFLEWLRA